MRFLLAPFTLLPRLWWSFIQQYDEGRSVTVWEVFQVFATIALAFFAALWIMASL